MVSFRESLNYLDNYDKDLRRSWIKLHSEFRNLPAGVRAQLLFTLHTIHANENLKEKDKNETLV